MRRNVFTQVFAATMGFFLLCCVILGVAAYRYTSGAYTEQLREEIACAAASLEAAGESALPGISRAVEARVTLIAADGRVLYDSEEDPMQMENHSDRSEVREALASGSGESHRYSATNGGVWVYLARRLENGTVLRLAAPPYSVFNLFLNLFTPLLIALVLAVGLSFLLAMGVSRSVLRPIDSIDLTGPDERDVYPELKPLVRRINTQNRQIRHQMEELKSEHERQDTMRRDFTANVTHELKTPLTSISGYAELMRDGLVRPEDVSTFGGRIYDESQRLITLVEDIIKLSRLESRANMPEKSRVDLYELCGTVLFHLEQAARRRQVTLQLTGQPVTVFGVEPTLYEMVYNLCDNGIKYNRPGGSLTVQLEDTPQGVRLSVIDTGIGIPEEDVERIFERFYRVDKSHSKEVGGTGLGLSIVKHGAAFHLATVEVKSTLGDGTTMVLQFPTTAENLERK